MSKIWKRSIALLLVVCTLVGYIVLPDAPEAKADTTTTTVGPNLIANGTFGTQKTVTTYPQQAMPAGWAVGGNKVADQCYLQVTNEYAYDGQYAMKLVDALADKAISGYQDVTVLTPADAGASFEASIYGKGTGSVQLTMEFYSSDTSFVSSGTSKTLIKSVAKAITLTDEWTLYTNKNTIPEGTESVRFKITTNKANIAEFFFDKAKLTVGEADTNVLTNDSFETLPDATPTTQGSGGADTTGWSNLEGIWSVVPEEGNETNLVAKVVDDNPSGGKYIYYGVDVEPGATYTFKGDYKGTYTTGAPSFILRKDTYNGEALHTKTGLAGDTWQTYETTLEIPAGVTKIFIVISSASAAMGTAYFDNLSLQKVTTTTGGNEGGNEGGSTTPVTGNMIANGTFEKNGEINMEGWTNLPTAKSWSVVADPDKAGNFILQLADVYTDAGGYIYYTLEPAVGTYKLKFDYKTEDAPQIIVRANAASTAGDELTKINLPSTNGEWKPHEITVEVPVTASNVNILFNSANAVLNSGYFDNISFELVEAGGNQGGGEDIKPGEEILIPEQNLLGNPFFELTMYTYNTPIDASTAPNGWTLETTGTGVQVFKTNSQAYQDEWSVRFVDNSTTGSIKLSYKVENIVPGEQYRFIRSTAGTGTPIAKVAFYDADGNFLSENTKNIAAKTNWAQTSLIMDAPENASYAIFSLESQENKTCDLYLDDVRFYRYSDEAETNLLPNDSFEEYPESLQDVLVSARNEATTKGWKMSGADRISLVATETELDKNAVGNYMLRFDDDTSTAGCNAYYEMDVVPGKTYAFSAMIRGQYTEGKPSIRLAYYQDENCKTYAPIGSKNYITVQGSPGPDYWSRISASATAPENAVKMRVYVVSANAAVGWLCAGNLAVVEGIDSRFYNLDFEDTDKSGAVTNWEAFENGKISANKKDVFAGKIALQIKDNSQAVQQGAITPITDLSGYQHAGYSADQFVLTLGARVKDAKNVKAQLSLVYYDNGFKEVGRDTVTSNGSGKWQFLVLDSKMPTSAAYAKILLAVGDKAATTGTVYLDDVTLIGEYGQLAEEAYDWQVKEKEGNRLFFTDAELKKIKEFAKDDTLNPFGASGANAYRKLITQADSFVNETHYYMGWDASPNNDRVTLYRIDLEHIQDISSDPLLADVPGGRNWPYLEGISSGIYTRFSTVAMAYALTGDTKYSDQAIDWALDLCEWEYWCDTKYCWPSKYNGTLDTPRLMRAMAVVYDMCYDQLTQAQRDLIVENIIHKGLKPMYMDMCHPNMIFHNKWMARAIGMIIAGSAIINEKNKAEVGKYMDKAYAYCEAFLDERYTTANNEGYSYTKMSTDDMLVAMDCANRVTGREGLLKHPFFEEVLVDWVVDFIAPGSNEFPVYSDSYASGFFKPTMLILNRATGNGKAGYFLQQVGMDEEPFNTLIYGNYEPVITEPTENDYVVFAERVGYGGMRTGWEDGDLMFYIIGNNSNTGHNNYDQLSFQITTSSLWPAADPGYSSDSYGFDEQEGHNAIIVDGIGQSVKGTATLAPIVDAQLYGQLSGSAPETYTERDEAGKTNGIPMLTQWDRHAIMLNHGDRPYYIVIDEIASDKERMFDFNLNTGGWEDITVDGKPMKDGVNKGNKVAIYGNQGYFFVEFVSKTKLNIEGKMYPDGGPVLQADNGKQTSQQFMTIMTKPYGIELDASYSFLQLLNTPELVSYKTSSHDAVITKSVNASGNALYFFRGQSNGDWIELPFTLEETGTYDLILKTAKSYNYGIYKVYIDGEYVATYDGYDQSVFVYNLSLGKREITAGDHMLKLELTGVNPKSIGALISVASITFGTEREMPDHPIYTQEVYDTDKVLGAKIFHTVNNYDIVLHNRQTGKITAGGVTTTGEQAAIIGVMEDGYMEGFTVVAGTSLVFNGKTLVKSTSAATVSADFRGKAQYAVTTEKEQSISLYVPYEVVGATVDGKSVKYSVDGNVAKVSVPAGTHTVALQVKEAVEYIWGHESGSGKALYNENGEMIYKYWKDIDGTEYLFEDGQVKINAYFDAKSKVLIREELLENGDWQITTYDLIGNVASIEIQHTNGNLTTIKYQTDGSVSTTVTDSRGNVLEMIMEYKDGSKTVAQYLDDKTVTTKYGVNGNVLAVTTMYNDGRRVEETYDENGKLLSKITRAKGGDREEVIYNADGSVVTSTYVANKLASIKTVYADGTSVLEEYLEDGTVRVTKYDKDGNVTEVTINGKPVEEETDNTWLWIVIAIGAVVVAGVAVLVVVLVKVKKRNAKEDAEESASEE